MGPKILVFDKFFGYGVGGAQHSFHYLLKNLSADFKFIGCDVQKGFSAKKYETGDFSVQRIAIKEIPKFPYLEYFLNRKKIIQFFASQKGDYLFAQSFWAPLAINNFQGKSVYFIRDEYVLNKIPNYYSGIKFWLKKVYLSLQYYPFLRKIFSDNQKALEKATLVIANSNFIKGLIREKFNRESEVIYPMVDVLKLQKIKLPLLSQRPYLTLIGSEFIKGREIVERIAEKMKNHQFMIVGREFKKPFQKENILYQPWIKQPLEIYQKAKILLLPSLGQEAFARVAVEGAALGIPSLASKKGGLPEFFEERFLIEDVWHIDKWVEKIKEIEKNYQNYSGVLKEKALKFDARGQVANFKKIAREKLNLQL